MTLTLAPTLAVLAAALLLARLVLFVVLHLRYRHYSPVRHAVSDYGVGPSRTMFRWMGVVGGLSWLALAGAVLLGQHGWADRVTVVVWLTILAVTVFVVLAFPTDLEGEKLTRTGLLHYLAAIAQFAIIYAFTGNFVRLADRDAGLAVMGGTLGVLHWIALVALVGVVITMIPRLRRIFGLCERVFLLATLVFYLLVAIGLTR